MALGLAPGCRQIAAQDARVDVEEGFAHRPGEREVGLRIAGPDIVVEDAADAARFLAVRQVEILVAPGLEFLVRRDAGMGVAGGLERAVEGRAVGIVLGAPPVEHRGEVGAAAEPGFCGDDEAGVHVHRRHVRITQVRDHRHAGRPEPRILGGAWNLRAEFRRELAKHRRAVHADLLEQASAHHRHDAAAAGRPGVIGPVPRGADEPRRRVRIKIDRGVVFERFKRRADIVAQALEPGPGALLAILDRGRVG